MANGQITITVGHDPVYYRRYGKRASVRTFRRIFQIVDGSPLEEFHEANAREAAREYCKQMIDNRLKPDHTEVNYLHVRIYLDGGKVEEVMWSPKRGWYKKS